jgi:hypothetical protein
MIFSRETGGWADYQIRHWREEPRLQTAVRGALRLLCSQHRYMPFFFILSVVDIFKIHFSIHVLLLLPVFFSQFLFSTFVPSLF